MKQLLAAGYLSLANEQPETSNNYIAKIRMAFNDFRFRVAFRVVLVGLTMALFVYMATRPNMIFAAGLMLVIIIGQLIELYRFSSVL